MGSDAVRWVLGDANALPPLQVDLAIMTGNVAMVFTTDEQWGATVAAVHAAVRPGGRFVFETRIPERQAWLEWTPSSTFERVDWATPVRSPTGSRSWTCSCRS